MLWKCDSILGLCNSVVGLCDTFLGPMTKLRDHGILTLLTGTIVFLTTSKSRTNPLIPKLLIVKVTGHLPEPKQF